MMVGTYRDAYRNSRGGFFLVLWGCHTDDSVGPSG